jgi:hypothetical protein
MWLDRCEGKWNVDVGCKAMDSRDVEEGMR